MRTQRHALVHNVLTKTEMGLLGGLFHKNITINTRRISIKENWGLRFVGNASGVMRVEDGRNPSPHTNYIGPKA